MFEIICHSIVDGKFINILQIQKVNGENEGNYIILFVKTAQLSFSQNKH